MGSRYTISTLAKLRFANNNNLLLPISNTPILLNSVILTLIPCKNCTHSGLSKVLWCPISPLRAPPFSRTTLLNPWYLNSIYPYTSSSYATVFLLRTRGFAVYRGFVVCNRLSHLRHVDTIQGVFIIVFHGAPGLTVALGVTVTLYNATVNVTLLKRPFHWVML